ncbi:MAG: hypothetical protein ACX939_00995 [Hyphococcus sp.]
MTGLNPILLGVTAVLALGSIGAASVLSPKMRPIFFFAVLVAMAAIYVGFAVIALDSADFISRPVLSILFVESALFLVLLFAGIAVLSAERYWLLGVLIMAHGGVDLLHLLTDTPHSPAWYEFLCVVYDAIVGLAAIWLLTARSAAKPEAAPSQ